MILSYITLYVLLSATIRNEIRDGRVDKGDKPGMGGGGLQWESIPPEYALPPL